MALNFNDINANVDYDYLCLHVKHKQQTKPMMREILSNHVEGLPIFNYQPKLTETADTLTYTFLGISTVSLKFIDEKNLEITLDFYQKCDPDSITIIDNETYYETLTAIMFRAVKKFNKVFRVTKITYVYHQSNGYPLKASTHCNVDILKILDFDGILKIDSEKELRTVFKNPRFVSYCHDHKIQFRMYDNPYSLNRIMPLNAYEFERDYHTNRVSLKHK